MRIQGSISFEGAVADISHARVFVQLVDVSRADAAAQTVAEHRLLGLPTGTNTSKEIPFELNAEIEDTRCSYAISAHIDVDSDGQISIGDYITMQSYPVYIESPSSFYTITVHRIER